ncbi:hypothetical protein SMALB_5295 [Streptomyces malaysiensis]|uniref:Uncharacterized protein n=1 Tax=Streptomyces malaysiensis TaxID=92644 RepID=A0A7X5X624_STRMQ|nr:hypothetical protein [Streptomyces malaysiensis]
MRSSCHGEYALAGGSAMSLMVLGASCSVHRVATEPYGETRQPLEPHRRQTTTARPLIGMDFGMPEFGPGNSIMSIRGNPLKWWTRRKARKTPLQQGAGYGIRIGNGPEIGSGKVGNTEGKRPERPVKRFRRKRPFLENSTACQKSTPDMLIPRPSVWTRFL